MTQQRTFRELLRAELSEVDFLGVSVSCISPVQDHSYLQGVYINSSFVSSVIMLDKSSVTWLLASGLSYLIYSVYSGTKGYTSCVCDL